MKYLSEYEKAIEKKELQLRKTRIKVVQTNTQNVYQVIDNATTFSKQDFIPFLLKLLQLTTNEDMESGIFIEPNPLRNILKEEFCEYLLVGEKEPVKQVKRMFGELSLSESIEKAKIKDYLVIPIEKEKIHMAKGLELRKEFRGFSEIQYAFERCIELSKNNNTSQKTRLNIILEEITENRKEARKRAKHLT